MTRAWRGVTAGTAPSIVSIPHARTDGPAGLVVRRASMAAPPAITPGAWPMTLAFASPLVDVSVACIRFAEDTA